MNAKVRAHQVTLVISQTVGCQYVIPSNVCDINAVPNLVQISAKDLL